MLGRASPAPRRQASFWLTVKARQGASPARWHLLVLLLSHVLTEELSPPPLPPWCGQAPPLPACFVTAAGSLESKVRSKRGGRDPRLHTWGWPSVISFPPHTPGPARWAGGVLPSHSWREAEAHGGASGFCKAAWASHLSRLQAEGGGTDLSGHGPRTGWGRNRGLREVCSHTDPGEPELTLPIGVTSEKTQGRTAGRQWCQPSSCATLWTCPMRSWYLQ